MASFVLSQVRTQRKVLRKVYARNARSKTRLAREIDEHVLI